MNGRLTFEEIGSFAANRLVQNHFAGEFDWVGETIDKVNKMGGRFPWGAKGGRSSCPLVFPQTSINLSPNANLGLRSSWEIIHFTVMAIRPFARVWSQNAVLTIRIIATKIIDSHISYKGWERWFYIYLTT